MQRTCIWPEILLVTGTWSTRCVTKETWDVENSTVCRADHFWGGREGGGDDGVRDWLILKKMYTCTLYVLEMHIGKKRILHKYTVQKKKSSTFSELKKPHSRCSLDWQSWQHKLYFPTVMIKRFCICTCVPGKKVHSIRIFSSQMAFSCNLQHLW